MPSKLRTSPSEQTNSGEQRWQLTMGISTMIAFVTGANGGIGSHFVEQLRSLGSAKTYIGARTLSKLS